MPDRECRRESQGICEWRFDPGPSKKDEAKKKEKERISDPIISMLMMKAAAWQRQLFLFSGIVILRLQWLHFYYLLLEKITWWFQVKKNLCEKLVILGDQRRWDYSSGLHNLVRQAMEGLGEITVVAPDSPQSGMGHAITINQPFRLDKVDVYANHSWYQCSGTLLIA